EIALDGFTGRNSVRIQQLASSDIYQVNDEVYPEHVVPSHFDRKLESSHLQFTFPAASVTRIDFGPG
ncbi:MAG: hypothetical protein JO061_13700, partial [Acidobacteriaceae bacterium]|nr:hypothetical protein [Acidobacteriaceae bacterium]